MIRHPLSVASGAAQWVAPAGAESLTSPSMPRANSLPPGFSGSFENPPLRYDAYAERVERKPSMARQDGAVAPTADAGPATLASAHPGGCDAPMLHELPQTVTALRDIVRGAERKAVLPPVTGAMRDLSGLALARLMHNYGLPALRSGFAATPDEAALIAGGIGYPVSLSAVVSATGASTATPPMVAGLGDANAVRAAAERMTRGASGLVTALEGFRVQESPLGDVFAVGIAAPAEFGPFIALGPGTSSREAAHRLVVRTLPVDADGARDLLRALPVQVRRASAGGDALPGAIVALSRFFLEHRRWLAGVEVAPLFVLAEGTQVRVGNVRIARGGPFSIP